MSTLAPKGVTGLASTPKETTGSSTLVATEPEPVKKGPLFLRPFRVLRNNWKKSILFSVLGVWGLTKLYEKHLEYELKRIYFREAMVEGEKLTLPSEKLTKVVVVLNPASRNASASKLMDKNVFPFLHLSGLDVSIIRSKRDTDIKDAVGVLDASDADLLMVAGGNGTVIDSLTGLLRNPTNSQFARKTKLAIVPLGTRNTLGSDLQKLRAPLRDVSKFNFFPFTIINKRVQDSVYTNNRSVSSLLSCGLSVVRHVRGDTKLSKVYPIQVLSTEDDKPVFAVEGLKWGVFSVVNDYAKDRFVPKPVKPFWAYLSSIRSIPSPLSIKFEYTTPCHGCPRCAIEDKNAISKQNLPAPTGTNATDRRWWSSFTKNQFSNNLQSDESEDENDVEYSSVVNPECGLRHYDHVETSQVEIERCLAATDSHRDQFRILIYPIVTSLPQFFSLGLASHRHDLKKLEELGVRIYYGRQVSIEKLESDDKSEQTEKQEKMNQLYFIDNEPYDVKKSVSLSFASHLNCLL